MNCNKCGSELNEMLDCCPTCLSSQPPAPSAGKLLKARNGDTLADLEKRREEQWSLLIDCLSRLEAIESKAKPIRERADEIRASLSNIECRLDIWLAEYPQTNGSPLRPNGELSSVAKAPVT